jgi:DNA polymerase-3 subunit gamma/tau
MARVAAGFSEEDLTRYLQLSLDLFRDLQFSLQPRFHLEIGLLKMIQAGKLIPIEEALASLGKPVPETPRPVASVKSTASSAPFRALPATSELKAPETKKAAAPAPVNAAPPSPDDDWRAKLQTAMRSTGLEFSADAIAQADVSLVNNELQITASKQLALDLGRDEIQKALKHLGYPALRFKVTFGETKSAPAPVQPAAAKTDEVTERALAHPEVQRFRELFGGEVRTVRNLKES